MQSHRTPLTFLFTDIVGSTRLWQVHGDGMRAVLEIHYQAIKSALEIHNGHVFAGGGDGFGVVFTDPTEAVDAAIAIQSSLADIHIGDESLKIRIGVHTGIAQARDDDYFGLAVNRAARLTSAAHGDQTLISSVTANHLTNTATTPLGTYRLPDLLEPMEIHQVGAGAFPPIRALDPERHNLPERYTSLVGREALINEVVNQIEQHRLVTLVGPGGIGKTSVALACGALLSATSEGHRAVWLGELDLLVDGADVDPMVASLLGLGASDGWHRAAARRNAVLILDNAEHLIDDVAATVATLLRSGPDLRILVTSREPLQIPGERLLDVPPLGLDGDAAQLFIERSGEMQAPDALIAELVAATDGLPLAVELVASHISRIQPEDLIESLRLHGMESLSARGVADRHRTTGDAIRWSYDLLSSTDQRAFHALAVFSRTFSLTCAAHVGQVPTHTIISLVERSLIDRIGDRLRLLAPIKEFARRQLEDAGEVGEAEDQLVDFIVKETAEISTRLKPRDGEAWEMETSIEREDAITCAAVLIENQDLDRLKRLYLGFPGQWGIHRQQLRRAMETLDRGLPLLWGDVTAQRWTLFRHAWCLDLVSRESDALPAIERLLAFAVEHRDEYLVAACHALKLKITSVDPLIDPSELELLQEIASGYASTTEWWDPASLSFPRAVNALNRGDFAAAKALFELAERDLASKHNRAITALCLAECNRMLGDPHHALERLDSVERVPADLVFDLEQQRAHTLIELRRLDEALDSVQQLAALDIKQSGEETSAPFCAASDYFRAIGDHHVAAQMMAHMLNGREPWSTDHRRIIVEATEALGDSFDEVWARGRQMTAASLHALLREEAGFPT